VAASQHGPMKRSRRLCFSFRGFLWLLPGCILAMGGAMWWYLPPPPRFVIDADDQSYLMGFSPDGALLVTQGVSIGQLSGPGPIRRTGPIRLWNVTTGKEAGSFLGDGCGLGPVCWCSQDGSLLVSQTDDKSKERILDVRTGQERVDLTEYRYWLTTDESGFVMCLDHRDSLAGMAKDCRAFGHTGPVWDGFAEARTWSPWPTTWPTTVCSMSRDTALVVVGKAPLDPAQPPYEMQLMLWDRNKGAKCHELGLAPLSVTPFLRTCFSTDGKSVAVESIHWKGHQVSVFDVATGQRRAKVLDAQLPVFVRGDQTLAVVCPHFTQQWCIKLFDSVTGGQNGEITINSPGFDCSVTKLQCSPDGKCLVVGALYTSKPNSMSTWTARWTWLQSFVDVFLHRLSNGPALTLFDAVTGQELAALPPASCHWFSPDGKLFATKRWDEAKIRVWDVPPRKPWAPFAVMSAFVVLATAALAQWRNHQIRRPRQRK
jgi:WD40 repeat protein